MNQIISKPATIKEILYLTLKAQINLVVGAYAEFLLEIMDFFQLSQERSFLDLRIVLRRYDYNHGDCRPSQE